MKHIVREHDNIVSLRALDGPGKKQKTDIMSFELGRIITMVKSREDALTNRKDELLLERSK